MQCPHCEGDCHKTSGSYNVLDDEKELIMLASLHVWLQTPWGRARYVKHNHMRIPASDSRAFLDENREALLEVMARAKEAAGL